MGAFLGTGFLKNCLSVICTIGDRASEHHGTPYGDFKPYQQATFELQGHRGARGLKPENTLPAFETAFDLGVSSIENRRAPDRRCYPILFHDSSISDDLCHAISSAGAKERRIDFPSIH